MLNPTNNNMQSYTSDFTDELSKSASESEAEMGFKEACLEISAAKSRGAPIYDDGDHSGSYNIYRQTAEKIIKRCSLAVVRQKLRLDLSLAEKQSRRCATPLMLSYVAISEKAPARVRRG